MAELKEEITLADVKAEAAAYKEEKEKGKMMQLIIFKLGSEEYALHIDQIKEVVLTPNIAKIPQTPDYIKGVANIRGNIIAIVDLERKFNLAKGSKEEQEKKGNYTLVVESESFKIGVLVMEVPNTLTVSEADIDKSSTVLQYSNLNQDCIKGIVKAGDRMVIMVDMIKMMESEELHKVSRI
ncbi:MAG: chemotaxis protein CheW [Luteibaculum sp.]